MYEETCDLTCPVCMDFFTLPIQMPQCIHVFCTPCIEKTIETGARRCPLCKRHVGAVRRAIPRDDLRVRSAAADSKSGSEEISSLGDSDSESPAPEQRVLEKTVVENKSRKVSLGRKVSITSKKTSSRSSSRRTSPDRGSTSTVRASSSNQESIPESPRPSTSKAAKVAGRRSRTTSNQENTPESPRPSASKAVKAAGKRARTTSDQENTPGSPQPTSSKAVKSTGKRARPSSSDEEPIVSLPTTNWSATGRRHSSTTTKPGRKRPRTQSDETSEPLVGQSVRSLPSSSTASPTIAARPKKKPMPAKHKRPVRPSTSTQSPAEQDENASTALTASAKRFIQQLKDAANAKPSTPPKESLTRSQHRKNTTTGALMELRTNANQFLATAAEPSSSVSGKSTKARMVALQLADEGDALPNVFSPLKTRRARRALLPIAYRLRNRKEE
ncbi:hypothetical protein DFS34DRAFT_8331 [Phlyctochytrium arcticum]|nr:hypothetical protein DFS34DRAFT_8331 [Phlyctochytrium arcticum]